MTFKPMLQGAGGYITTADISPDGLTMLVTKDAGGANVWNSAANKWDQLITTSRMPAADVAVGQYMGGTYCCVSAPGNSSVVYMVYAPNVTPSIAWLYKSTDRGQHFVRTGFSSMRTVPGQSVKFHSPKIAVDPSDPTKIILGVPPLSTTFTATNGVTNLATATHIGFFLSPDWLQIGEACQLTTTGTLPAGFSTGTTYWAVVSAQNTIQLSATRGGSPITPTSAGSGTHTLISASAYITTDSGTTWNVVPNIPIDATVSEPATGICFDPSSVGGNQGIFLWIHGNGLYHSTNGGTSFALVASGPSSPTNDGGSSFHGRIALDGQYFLVLGTNNTSTCSAWRLGTNHTTWTDLTATLKSAGATDPEGFASVCCDPLSAANVVINIGPGYNWLSADHGTTWAQSGILSSRDTTGDIPWLSANGGDPNMAVGDICLDPITPNKLWFSNGVGVWYSDATGSNSVTYHSQSRGIEQLINNQIVVPPNGYPMIVCWDRPVFTITNPDVYPSEYGPNHVDAVQHGYSVDWATSDPNFCAVLCNLAPSGTQEESSYSTNQGLTQPWTLFPTNPGGATDGAIGGIIACSTDQIMVWAESNHGDLFQTSNRGGAWARVTSFAESAARGGGSTGAIVGPPRDIGQGWGQSNFAHAYPVCADRQTTSIFYAHNCKTIALGGGTYKSINGGVDWLRQSVALASDFAQTIGDTCIKAVPLLTGANAAGVAGLLMFSSGGQGQYPYLLFSKDGGVTWNKAGTGAQRMGENQCFGFGSIKPGNDFPSVYVAGNLNGTFGIWRSDNSYADWTTAGSGTTDPNGTQDIATITWTAIPDSAQPLGNPDILVAIDGDKKGVWNKFYVATTNSGAFYFDPSSGTLSPIGFSVIHGHAKKHTRMIAF